MPVSDSFQKNHNHWNFDVSLTPRYLQILYGTGNILVCARLLMA